MNPRHNNQGRELSLSQHFEHLQSFMSLVSSRRVNLKIGIFYDQILPKSHCVGHNIPFVSLNIE